jgi:hypothetical protein
MDFWKRLFGRGELPPPAEGPTFSRSIAAHPPDPLGTERQAFLQGVAQVLERPAASLDLQASLVEQYGCADLDVSECVQVAEEIWGVQLMPNPMTAEDYAYLMRRLTSLQAIIDDAERRATAER